MTRKFKKKIATTIALFAVVLSALTPLTQVNADDDATDRQKIESALNSYVEDAESTSDILDKFEKEDLKKVKEKKNSISYVLYRTFIPNYINNVQDGVLARGLDDPRYDGKHVCNPNAPNNLLNHNCNVPNFSAELLQNFMALGSGSAISGGEITSAKAPFGLGVPNGIPGGKVPVDPVKRTSTYTALEIFGYNLPLTTYRGEWDMINKSTSARMLTNFGAMDKVTLVGRSLWNGVKSGLGASIEGFSFNPIRWALNVFTAAAGGSLNTIIDTSELNVIATDGWNRNHFNKTLYNVYVLTNQEVIRESALKYMRSYMNSLNKKASESPKLREVIALEMPPEFTYDPNRETEESKENRERIMKANIKIAEEAAQLNKEPILLKVPEPIMMTEEEQLKEWVKKNEAFLKRGDAQGLIDGGLKGIKDYDKFTKDWAEKWAAYSKREFDASGLVVSAILKAIDKALLKNDFYSDPKQPISHYVCANPDGTPMRKSNGEFEYLYTAKNNGSKESINPKCSAVRSPIGGGYFGDGWHLNRDKDTRHISNYDNSVAGPTSLSHRMTQIFAQMNSFIAKITNSILNLSFSPILESLGITDIVVGLMKSFRDTMFFPLAALFVTLGAFLMFVELLKNRSAWTMVKSIFITFIIFVSGAMFLLRTDLIVDSVEKIPNKIDNGIADMILKQSSNGAEFCNATGDKQGIRTAQCKVWNSMVFEPWVQAQFGTSYNNLYAKGYVKKGGSEMKNSNEDLVGNAAVNLGGGKIENNWALYQLSKMKSGTITTEDKSRAVGMTDPHIYKLVDLQAGPNGGELSDSRYLRNWTGENGGRITTLMMASLRSIMTMLAIGSLGIIKIEQSLLFSLGLIFLPIMLLSGLTEKGRPKLINYLMRLLSFFLKRVMTVVMLTVLIRLVNLTYTSNASYSASVMGSMAILTAFMIYRKELLNLFAIQGQRGNSLSDPETMRELISNTTPKFIRNQYARTRANVRGSVAGAVGGFAAGLTLNRTIDKENKKREEMAKEIYGDDYNPETDYKLIDKSSSMGENMMKGLAIGHDRGGRAERRKTERKIRKSGFSVGEIYSASSKNVVEKGIESITNNEEPLASEVLKYLLHESDKGSTYNRGNKDVLSESDKELLYDKRIQKLAREEAAKRKEIIELTGDVEVPIKIDTKEATKLIDKRKDIQIAKSMMKQPLKSGHIRSEAKRIESEKLKQRLNPGGISNVEEIRKQIIENREKEKEDNNEDKE